MAQVYQGAVQITDAFKYGGKKPLDPRTVVEYYSDLTALDDSGKSHPGLKVFVTNEKKTYTKVSEEAGDWEAESGGTGVPIAISAPTYVDGFNGLVYQRTFELAWIYSPPRENPIRVVVNGQSFNVTLPGSQSNRILLSGIAYTYFGFEKQTSTHGTHYLLYLRQESISADTVFPTISTVEIYAPYIASYSDTPIQAQDYTEAFLERRTFHTTITMSYASDTSSFTGLLTGFSAGSDSYMVFGIITRSNNMSTRYSFSGLWNGGTTVIYPLDAESYIRLIDEDGGVRVRIDGTAGGASMLLVNVYFIRI